MAQKVCIDTSFAIGIGARVTCADLSFPGKPGVEAFPCLLHNQIKFGIETSAAGLLCFECLINSQL